METEVPNNTIGVPTYILIRDQLRREIISGKLPSGMRLLPAEIARRFGVSQMPVRGALQQLEGEGIITILPHRGARVRSFNKRLVRNVYDLRAVVEGLMARLSIPYITPAVMEKLNNINKRLRAVIETGTIDVHLSLNRDFHRTLYVLSGNSEALDIFEKYLGLIGALRNQYGFRPQRGDEILEDHVAILEALRVRDASLVEEQVRNHTQRAKKDLLSRISECENTQAEIVRGENQR